MNETITTEIEQLCDENGVLPLCARQMGSRMVGASHDESDHDVMFLFVQDPARHYLSEATSTVRNHSTGPDGKIDIWGWDIKKFAHHMEDSNPTAVEFALGGKPVIEWSAYAWQELQDDIAENANLMALHNHYISMATSNYKKYVEGEALSDGNRQFHVGRASLMAAYIRVHSEIPPMDISELLMDSDLPFTLRFRTAFLLQLRRIEDGDFTITDRIGDAYEYEYDKRLEPTDRRTRNPNRDLIDNTVRAAIDKWQEQNTTAPTATHTSR